MSRERDPEKAGASYGKVLEITADNDNACW
jgi:hypothetical protein